MHGVADADSLYRRWTSTGQKARRTGVLVVSVTHRSALGRDP